jgi:tRNA U34 2-thiouridine synthase MnmA/TrmU
VRELPRQLTADRLAELFESRTRLVELLAEREYPFDHAQEVIGGLTDAEKREVLDSHPAIGQKKGLGLALGRPVYVVELDPERDTVVVGDAVDLERDRLVARAVNFIACAAPTEPLRVEAKIRHNHAPAPATVRLVDADTAEVVFDEPQRAITPGQSVVWYRGECVVGGGVIAR